MEQVQKYLKKSYFIYLLLLTGISAHAQQLEVNHVTRDITVCEPASFQVSVKPSASASGITFDDFTAILSLPTGIEYNGQLNVYKLDLYGTSTSLYATETILSSSSAEIQVQQSDTDPSFSLAADEELIIEYEVYPTCDLKVVSSGANNVVITYNSGQSTGVVPSNTYSILSPNIHLGRIEEGDAEQKIAGIVGDIITLTLPISNGAGSAPVDELRIKITHADRSVVDNRTFSILNPVDNSTTTLAANGVGNHYEIIIQSADFQAINLDNSLDGTESFKLVETVEVLSCTQDIQNINYTVEWGCTKNITYTACDDKSADVYIQQPGNLRPDIITQLNFPQKGNYCSTNLFFNININNNGSERKDRAKDLTVEIPKTDINISSVALVASGGSEVPLNYNSTTSRVSFSTLTTDPDGVGGLEALDADGVYNDLPEREQLQLKVYYDFNCPAACSPIYRSLRAATSYTDVCGNAGNIVRTALLEDKQRQLNAPVASGPSDMIAGAGSEFFEFHPRVVVEDNEIMAPCANEQYTAEITLPANYSVDNSYTPRYIDSDGTSATLSVNQTNNKVYLTGAGLTNGVYKIKLQLNCANPTPSDGFANISWKLLQDCYGGSCTTCKPVIACATKEIYNHYRSCGNDGGGGGGQCRLTAVDFTAERVSFGWESNSIVLSENDLTILPRANKNTPNINLKAAYECDTFLTTATADVFFTGNCRNSEDVHVRITSRAPASGAIMEYIEGVVRVQGQGQGQIQTRSIQAVPVVSSNSAYGVTVWDIQLPAGLNLNGSKTLEVKAWYKVPKNTAHTFLGYNIPRFRGEFYIEPSDGSNVGLYTNENWGDNFSIYNPQAQLIDSTTTASNYLCDAIRMLRLNVRGGLNNEFLTGGNDFPNEFRDIAHFNNIEYRLPPKYNYEANSAKLQLLDGNTPVSGYSNIAVGEPVITGNINSGLILTWNRNDLWPLVDKFSSEYSLNLLFNVTPQCDAPTGNNLTITSEYTDYNYSVQCEAVVSGQEAISDPRTLPNLNFNIAANQQGTARTTTFTVGIINSGNTSQNTWIAFEAGASSPGISFVQAYDANDPTQTPLNGYFYGGGYLFVQAGMINGGTQKQIKLVVEFTACESGDQDQIDLYTGWGCDGYPDFTAEAADFSAADYNSCTQVKTATLTFTHAEGDLTLRPFTPVTPQPLCQDSVYTINIYNSGASALYNLNYWMELPEGLEIVGGQINYQYNGVSGTINPADLEAPSSSGNLSPIVPVFNPNEIIQLTFNLNSTCNFDPGEFINFYARAASSCGDVFDLEQNRKIRIENFDFINNISVDLQGGSFSSSSDGSAQIAVEVVNNGSNVTLESPSYVEVIIPNALVLVPGSHSPSSGFSTTITSNGETLVRWEITALPSGAVNNYSFSIRPKIPDAGDAAILSAQAVISKTLSCGTETCLITGGSPQADLSVTWGDGDGVIMGDCATCIPSFSPEPGRYILSAWVKENTGSSEPKTYSNHSIILHYTTQADLDQELLIGRYSASSSIIDGWQRIEAEFVIPEDAIFLYLYLKNEGSNGVDVYFDDIRIHPFDGNMKSFAYDPVTLQFIAELDENNYATYYEYDEEGKLIRTKKETERGVMTIQESRSNTKKK